MTSALDVRRIPPIGREEVWRLAATEYDRFVDLLRALGVDDWSRPTDCHRWDVRAIALHVLGATEANASPRELLHQFRRGFPLNREIESHHWVDGVNELQVRERSHLDTQELVGRLVAAAPRAVRMRRLAPVPIRWTPTPIGPPIGWKPLTYLLRMGFTRDVWMHRIDIARAAEREIALTPDHDGRLVADIVAEWAAIHARPCRLELTGPAGGAYICGDGGEELEIDALDFCRILSGRGEGSGVLAHKLPL